MTFFSEARLHTCKDIYTYHTDIFNKLADTFISSNYVDKSMFFFVFFFVFFLINFMLLLRHDTEYDYQRVQYSSPQI